jgi:hypothetical protein
MWRFIRIAILLFILATVAQTAWLARSRTAEWRTSLRVVLYPISTGTSGVGARYVSELRDESFDAIEAFFVEEGRRHALPLAQPVEVALAPAIVSEPPPPPFGGSKLRVILWSLELRYWAWRNDTYKGPKPHVRVFVSFHDAAERSRLPHSTGLHKGMIGVVNAFARTDMNGSNNVVIAHELLHTLGATDKYDAATNQPLFPEGYAEPKAQPLHPQARAEIMAGRIALSESQAETPAGMKHVVIGEKTAREINWVR